MSKLDDVITGAPKMISTSNEKSKQIKTGTVLFSYSFRKASLNPMGPVKVSGYNVAVLSVCAPRDCI